MKAGQTELARHASLTHPRENNVVHSQVVPPPGPEIEGLTAGRNSFLAIAKQIETKIANGEISAITGKTALKILAGDLTEKSGDITKDAVIDAIKEALTEHPEEGKCPH